MSTTQRSEPASQAPQLVLQTTCDLSVLVALCDEHGVDSAAIVERRGLDGDPFVYALALAATAPALRSIEGIVRALLEHRHPIKVTKVGKDGTAVSASGIGTQDLPAVQAFFRSAPDSTDDDESRPGGPS
jgi:hypothetical protein